MLASKNHLVSLKCHRAMHTHYILPFMPIFAPPTTNNNSNAGEIQGKSPICQDLCCI